MFTAGQTTGHAVCVADTDCVITTPPVGLGGLVQWVTTYGSHHFEVMIERPDGSLLTASAVQVGDAGMPVTKAQLIGLAQSDRWVHLGN